MCPNINMALLFFNLIENDLFFNISKMLYKFLFNFHEIAKISLKFWFREIQGKFRKTRNQKFRENFAKLRKWKFSQPP